MRSMPLQSYKRQKVFHLIELIAVNLVLRVQESQQDLILDFWKRFLRGFAQRFRDLSCVAESAFRNQPNLGASRKIDVAFLVQWKFASQISKIDIAANHRMAFQIFLFSEGKCTVKAV